jgi:hypothetical protein
MSQVVELPIDSWTPAADADAARALERGAVLNLPKLAFVLQPDELRFLDPRWSTGARKNISFKEGGSAPDAARGSADELDALRAMLERYRAQASSLIHGLLPHYRDRLAIARASFRPARVEGRVTSWRKDDSRLHIDAFPSRPNRGERILRVFANVNHLGEPRVWRVGEPFEDVARRFVPKIPRQLPGSAALLRALRITKSRRSEYDHYMLHLHDSMKRDLDYQRSAPQQTVNFPAGGAWICFSDQTSHAAMAGQFLMEQTMNLPVAAMYDEQASPLRILERLVGRALA